MDVDYSGVFRRAEELVLSGWARYGLATDECGTAVPYWVCNATRFDVNGAVARANFDAGNDDLVPSEMLREYVEQNHGMQPGAWNDHPLTTVEDVARVLRTLAFATSVATPDSRPGVPDSPVGPRVQFVHMDDPSAPDQCVVYVHCARCLRELPQGVSPRDWDRLSIGFTPNGIQVLCVRHRRNVDRIEVRVK